MNRFLLWGLALLFSGCIYEAPLTTEPTRKVDDNLVGTWVTDDPEQTVEIRKFDDSHYVLLNDGQFYRAFHSDLDGVPFVSIQSIDSLTDRKFWLVEYKLSSDQLTVRAVNTDTIPKTLKTTDEIAASIRAHLGKADLFDEKPLNYRRQKAAQ